MNRISLTVLVVEPNPHLAQPYHFLPSSCGIIRVATIPLGIKALLRQPPDLVCLSASFTPALIVQFLEHLRHSKDYPLVPILFVVDLNHRLNFIPGTTWTHRLAVVDSFASHAQLETVLARITLPPL